jgi:hypothetical protein
MTRMFRRDSRCYPWKIDSLSERWRHMAQVYFHCYNTDGVWVDRRGAVLSDLAEAQRHAALVVQSLLMAPSTEDWREWVLHVIDDLDNEIFRVPFASLLGKPH